MFCFAKKKKEEKKHITIPKDLFHCNGIKKRIKPEFAGHHNKIMVLNFFLTQRPPYGIHSLCDLVYDYNMESRNTLTNTQKSSIVVVKYTPVKSLLNIPY